MEWSPWWLLPFLACLRVPSRAPACARSFCSSKDSGALLGKVLAQAGPPAGGEDLGRSARGRAHVEYGPGKKQATLNPLTEP